MNEYIFLHQVTIDFNQSGSTNLTLGWKPEKWAEYLAVLVETINYKGQVFELNSSIPVREMNWKVQVASKADRRVTIDRLKENTEYRISIVTRVKCSDYESVPSYISFTTRDGLPLVNPIAKPGSYEWLDYGCSVRVYWAHPPIESVRGELTQTEVLLFKTTSDVSISSANVSSSRTHHTFDLDSEYCSGDSAASALRVHLSLMTRSGRNSTLAPTVLHIRRPAQAAVRSIRNDVHVKCQSDSKNSTCSALTVALLLEASDHSSSYDPLDTAVVSHLILCQTDDESTTLTTCSYVNDCNSSYREHNREKSRLTLHVLCALAPSRTREQIKALRVGVVLSWNIKRSNLSSSIQNKTKALEELHLLMTSPIQWTTCSRATVTSPAACPRAPSVPDVVSSEHYNFFEAYKVKVRWISNAFECGTSLQNSIPAFFEVYLQSTEESKLSFNSTCESSKEAHETLHHYTRVAHRIIAQLNASGEAQNEISIDGLVPSLTGGGRRYRLSLLAYDLYGSRVTRTTLVFPVAGFSRCIVISSIVAMFFLGLIIMSFCIVSYYIKSRSIIKKITRSSSKPENSALKNSDIYKSVNGYIPYHKENQTSCNYYGYAPTRTNFQEEVNHRESDGKSLLLKLSKFALPYLYKINYYYSSHYLSLSSNGRQRAD